MNLAEFAIRNRLISALVIIAALYGGWHAYQNMPRFEDPEFTIRIAQITTQYPGAAPTEVLNEVTEPLETAVQQLQEVDYIESVSSAGLSRINVNIKYEFSRSKSDLQLIWGKVRNKIEDAQAQLPPGALSSRVNDDFGDVFGLYYLLTGEGYSPAELNNYAKELRKELLQVDNVANVAITGVQDQALYVEISRERAAALGVSLNNLYAALTHQNAVVAAGDVVLGDDRITIQPSGELHSVDAIENLVVQDAVGGLTRLRDIAVVTRGYKDPAEFFIRYNGAPALAIGVSNVTGANVVKLGAAIDERLAAIDSQRPIGMELHEFYHQGKVVNTAIEDFAMNVVMALVIVFGTLLVFMGYRSGLIMGATVLITMSATLLIMFVSGIPMHRISLGALVISLGMLVDNGVVITDGILVGVRQGRDKLEIAKEVARKNLKPLLGGTLVGIIAFAPIGFAPGQTAEYTNHLFWVVMIALGLSWFFAFTITPLFCYLMFNEEPATGGQSAAPSESGFLRAYKNFIRRAVNHRPLVIIGAIGVFAAAMWGFQFVTSGFFPASTTPQVVVDYWLPEGADIERTAEDMERLETYVRGLDGVEDVQTLIGSGTLRYMLVYQFEPPNSAYGQILIKTSDYSENDRLLMEIQDYINANFPEGQGKTWKFVLGPGGGSKIEATFKGPDASVLRELANEAKAIMSADSGARSIKDDWRRRVSVIEPVYSETKGQRVGVTREDLADALQRNFSGKQVGVYREGEDLIPIISRAPANERQSAANIRDIQILSSTTGRVVPLAQVLDGARTIWRDGKLRREDRVLTIKAQCDPIPGELAGVLFERLRPQIEAIELPVGYSLEWDGEYGDSTESQGELATTIPLGLITMILVVVILFNKIRQPIIIWTVVPLGMIGVTIGLLATGTPMEFMAILGVLSLSGLLIQNSLVLVDHTDNLIKDGMPRFDAIIESAASRLRPVTMGAFTTVLGVIPLYFDAFFKSMTVVIIFGLSFATIITLFITPVLYAMWFNINRHETAAES